MASELPSGALGNLASSIKNIVTGVPLEAENTVDDQTSKKPTLGKTVDKTVDKTVETEDDVTVDKQKTAPVVHEDVKSREHEKIDTAVDHEVHKDHFHTTIQPVKDKNVLPTKHVYKENEFEENIDHRDNRAKQKAKEEAAGFHNEKQVEDTLHTRENAPANVHENVHHHIHETIQPVIERETVQQKVVHTTDHIHKKEQLNDEHHEATVAPAVSMAQFEKGTGTKVETADPDNFKVSASGIQNKKETRSLNKET